MIDISGLGKSFGSRRLFVDASLRVGPRDRIALVGPNGSGKTTLFEMMTGRQSPDEGSISITQGATLGYLEQETDRLRGRSLIDEVLRTDTETALLQHRLEVLEREMATAEPGPDRRRVVDEYGAVQDRFHHLGGYSAEAEAKRVLAGLGFEDADHDRPTESFSGGWQMRIALAKLLLSNPDVLLLDEPTNHLDLASVEWLETYLGRYEGAVLLISHDRDFLNGFAERVVEVTERKLVSYTGNYETFVVQKQQAIEQAERALKHQRDRRAQLELFVNRFRYKRSKAKQVQSKIKLLERMERIERPDDTKRTMNLWFPSPPRPGRVVIALEDVAFAYSEVPVYRGLDVAIGRGQKVALVGPNGAGKSTLLKLLAGALEPTEGRRKLGPTSSVGYFAQHQIDALDPTRTVMEELVSVLPPGSGLKPRPLLGRFLFSGDDVDKRVQVLSGGERTRLAFAKLLVQPFNLLCLDEPTNHLDMWSRDVLEDALSAYEGSLVLITHDRHLIRAVASNVIEVRNGHVTWFEGGYEYYLDKREPVEDETAPEPPASKVTGAKQRRRLAAEERARTKHLRDEITAIEEELARLVARREELTAQLGDPEAYSSGEDIRGLSRSFDTVRRRIDDLESRWDALTDALEEAGAYPAEPDSSGRHGGEAS